MYISTWTAVDERVTPVNNADFGQTVKYIIPRYGDKISSIDLELKLPLLSDVGYVNTIGLAIIDYVELKIGEIQIVKYNNVWLDVHDKKHYSDGQRAGMNEMVMRNLDFDDTSYRGGDILIIPLHFWFTDNATQSFPLSALLNQDISVYIKLTTLDKLWISTLGDVTSDPNYHIDRCNLLVNYVNFGAFEKYLIRSMPHKFLIQQVQWSEHLVKGTARINLDDFQHQVTEIFWVFRASAREGEKDWFNYTPYDAETVLDFDPMIGAKISFEGKDRIEVMAGRYFRMYQPFKYYKYIPDDYIYMYSFARYPDINRVTSGYCNFSQIQDKILHIKMRQPNIEYRLFLFATNYNVLSVQNGQAQLDYYTGN